MYTIVTGRNGIRYKKDARFVKKSDIPADILIKLEVGMTDIQEETNEPQVHHCIFCGVETKEYRLLNQEAIYLCEEHYYSETMGRIAQKVRQLNG